MTTDDEKSLPLPISLDDVSARHLVLEEQITRLAIRCDAIEGLFYTITERILASIEETEARKVLEDLRANIMIGNANVSTDGDWDKAERLALKTEAYATRLLDQIEHSANVLRKTRP
jgi:hypothetical protein